MTSPFRLLLIFALALFVVPGAGFAQTGDSAAGLTAQEYYANAERLYADGKYEEAGRLYQKLLDEFGKSKEAEGAIRSIRFRHAMCYVHQRKFGDALEPIRAALAQQPPLQTSEIQELQFWLGVAEIEEKDFPAAREALEKFILLFPPEAEKNPASAQQYPAAGKIPEARLLIGSAWLLEEKYKEAAEYYAGLKSGLVPENRSRSVVLQLYSLLQDNQNDEAMKVIGEEFPHIGDISQLVTFQTLTLELGSRWLEAGENRKAIACLQRVWPSERLLKHQEERLAELEGRLRAAEASPRSDPYTKFLLGQIIAKVKHEVESFQKIKSFDAALRLRLATAYQEMKRYREAALILEDMLRSMPPDNVVEQASVNLVQTWFQVGRWPKVIEASDAFRTIFPESKSIPLVLYLKGLAAQKDLKFDESLAAFDAILKDYKDSEIAPRALFMKGFTLLLAEKNSDAITVFETFGKTYPKHELADAAAYWRGMGFSLDKQFAEARTAMDEYLKDFPKGQFAGNAVFRKAYCAQQLEDYKTSIKELRSFMRTYPGHEQAGEARILLGDALMNEGEMEEGMAAFKGIPREETRFYEEGVFKTAKALKLMEEYDRLLDHLTAFQKENPRSPRVAEAIYQIGWVLRQDNKPDKARDLYWQAIQEHGDDPSIRSVEDLFPALARLYKGDESAQYIARLRTLGQEAGAKGQKTLKMRALWAAGSALKKSDPDQSRALMLEAAALANVQTTNPLLLADFAETLQSAGKSAESVAMYHDLVKWNPRAPQKDRALAALGFAELSNGNEAAALSWFDRYEKETLGSMLVGKVLLAKAGLQQKQGRPDDARATLEALLANPLSGGKEKAEALYRIGEIHMASGKPQLAVPYFQRIYVMHGRWAEWVAKAYVRSGEAFEKLKDTDSARKTYQELSGKEEFSGFPETARAKERLQALGGPIKEETP
ncbi:MAG: outer membrane protein assembly factor BamD [Verrucomicrobiaceae bacterium]|nr:MAG: outer membrane protein assembly factor BamD [Verrucomicrobiaceae bacterium]